MGTEHWQEDLPVAPGASDPYGLVTDIESNPGWNNGQRGIWYHVYDGGWFGLRHDYVNSFFVPNGNFTRGNTKAYDDTVDEYTRRPRELLNEIGAGAALASDVLEMVQAAGALAIVVVVPGPEDLVLAAAMSAKGIRFFMKIGEELVGIGKAGEKIALNADEALAVEKLAAKEAGAAGKAEGCALPSTHPKAPPTPTGKDKVLWTKKPPHLGPDEQILDLPPNPEWNKLPQAERDAKYWERNKEALDEYILLRERFRDSHIIKNPDSTYRLDNSAGSFLERERNRLIDRGYHFDTNTGYWVPR